LQHSHHVTGQFGWVGASRKIAFPLCALKATTQRNFAGGAAPGCFLPNGRWALLPPLRCQGGDSNP
jgi:hypothetical protein